jgi:ubiquinone/menaquinone biosynthesis C-methylase UbiE
MNHPQKTPDKNCCVPDDCCATGRTSAQEAWQVREQVREGYSKIAVQPLTSGCCGAGSTTSGGCCGPTTLTADQIAGAVGYSRHDLAQIPDGSNLGLSCGNPTAIASLKKGETVVDLGSGGGFDCFVAGPQVGPTGRVIGVDMTAEMLQRARQNTTAYRERHGLDNVEFRLGEIENLPVADASVDVVISNCVINLSPNKSRVWQEIARILRPGGRVAVSDIALLRPLPDNIRHDVESLVGCVAGAALVEDTRKMVEAAGFEQIQLHSRTEYIDAMTSWQDPLYQKIVASLPPGSRASDFITSLEVVARRQK